MLVSVSLDRNLIVGPGNRQLWLELMVLALVAFLGAWGAWVVCVVGADGCAGGGYRQRQP